MKLPNSDRARIPRKKIVEYLLSPSHRDGQHKAAFFRSFGFTRGKWRQLAEALREHAERNDVARVEPSPYGVRYVIEGTIKSPDGRDPLVRAVWFIDDGEFFPRLATAYPLKNIEEQ